MTVILESAYSTDKQSSKLTITITNSNIDGNVEFYGIWNTDYPESESLVNICKNLSVTYNQMSSAGLSFAGLKVTAFVRYLGGFYDIPEDEYMDYEISNYYESMFIGKSLHNGNVIQSQNLTFTIIPSIVEDIKDYNFDFTYAVIEIEVSFPYPISRPLNCCRINYKIDNGQWHIAENENGEDLLYFNQNKYLRTVSIPIGRIDIGGYNIELKIE